jgi:hypothetical protein
MASDTQDVSIEDLARRGNITSDNWRAALTCQDCRATWYGKTIANAPRGLVATEYCPRCGGQNVIQNEELPGALLLQPSAEWPDDDPFVGGGGGE